MKKLLLVIAVLCCSLSANAVCANAKVVYLAAGSNGAPLASVSIPAVAGCSAYVTNFHATLENSNTFAVAMFAAIYQGACSGGTQLFLTNLYTTNYSNTVPSAFASYQIPATVVPVIPLATAGCAGFNSGQAGLTSTVSVTVSYQ